MLQALAAAGVPPDEPDVCRGQESLEQLLKAQPPQPQAGAPTPAAMGGAGAAAAAGGAAHGAAGAQQTSPTALQAEWEEARHTSMLLPTPTPVLALALALSQPWP